MRENLEPSSLPNRGLGHPTWAMALSERGRLHQVGVQHPGSFQLRVLMMTLSMLAWSLCHLFVLCGPQMLPNSCLKRTGSSMRMTIPPMVELSQSKCVCASLGGKCTQTKGLFFLFQQIVELFLDSIHLWKGSKLLEQAF